MICFEVINLLPEYQSPDVFAEELDHVQCICEPWPISREPRDRCQWISFMRLVVEWIVPGIMDRRTSLPSLAQPYSLSDRAFEDSFALFFPIQPSGNTGSLSR